MMTVLRHIVLYLFVMNISSGALMYIGAGIGSITSYLSFILLLIYYFFVKKGKINLWMIVLGLLYFAFAGLQYYDDTSYFINVTIKYFIIILGGYEVVKRTSNKEFIVVLLLGSITILLHAAVLGGGSADYGRFSGFYINPNAAGFICISGYALAYSLENKRVRLLAQIIFTLMGLLTLSRTFIVLWIMLNLISLKINIKNIRVFVYGFGLLSLLLIFSELLPVKNPRIEQLKAITSSNEEVSVSEINEDSRTETWSKYFDDIGNKPFFGNGFMSFTKKSFLSEKVGIHNTFLLVWGRLVLSLLLLLLCFM